MKTATILTTVAAAATSAMAISVRHSNSTTTTSSFAGLAIRSGSEIQYATVNANGGYFYLGRSTETYCPSSIYTCPGDNSTLFVGGNSTLALAVETPGGQEVYVDGNGALTFTVPHSASLAAGAKTTGFSKSDGSHLTFEGKDWYACPEDDGSFQVYAVNGTSPASDCLSFSWLIDASYETLGAWEYL